MNEYEKLLQEIMAQEDGLKEPEGVKGARMDGASYPFVHSVSADDCEDNTMHAVYNAPEIGAGAEAFAALDGRTREEEPPMACVYASPGLMGRRRRGLFSRIFKREP